MGELGVIEGGLFAGALEFDVFAGAGHDDVEIDGSVLVFDGIEVEEGDVVGNTDADGCEGVGEGIGLEFAEFEEAIDGNFCGDVSAGYGSCASSAVGLKNIAVDPEGVAGHLVEIENGPHCTSNEALDFDGAAVLLAL